MIKKLNHGIMPVCYYIGILKILGCRSEVVDANYTRENSYVIADDDKIC